jgi:hypothetical protein
MRQLQKVDRTAGGKTASPHIDSSGPRGKRARNNRTTPIPRSQRASGDLQASSKASDISPWTRARNSAIRLSSSCSSPVRRPQTANETACTCSQINGCVCGGCVPTPSTSERPGRKATKNQIHLGRNGDHSEISSRQSTTPVDTAAPRFYCYEPDCSVSCSRESDLSRHQKSKHGDITFECSYPGCQFRHSRRDKVLKHTREVHANRSIACPAIVYNFSSAAEGANTLQDASRDQVNASKRPGLGVSQANPRTRGHQKKGQTASTTTRFDLLDAEIAAPDQSKPSGKVDDGQDAVARARPLRTPAYHLSDPKSRCFVVQRSRSLPRNSVSDLNQPTSKQTSVRITVGQLGYAAKRRDGGPLGRPVSTPPKLPAFAPEHSNSSVTVQPIASTHRDTAQPHASSSNPSSLHRLGSSLHDVGDSGRNPAPPQHTGSSWADVVRNSSNPTPLSSTVLPNDTENNDGASGGRIKVKRRKLNEEGHQEFFVCIGHHRGRSDLYRTPECETTLKKYFSQLE